MNAASFNSIISKQTWNQADYWWMARIAPIRTDRAVVAPKPTITMWIISATAPGYGTGGLYKWKVPLQCVRMH